MPCLLGTEGIGPEGTAEVLGDCVIVSDTEDADDGGALARHPFGGLSWVDGRFDHQGGHLGLHPA